MIHIDFETRGAVDLLSAGAHVYAMDPDTDALCACYAIGNGPVQRWLPGDPVPPDLKAALDDGMLLAAHNAEFDRLIWQYVMEGDYGWPRTELEDWYCTAAQARARGLPGKLKHLGRCLKLDTQKDKRGEELIKLMSVPPFQHTPELLEEMLAYCERDVVVERAAAARSVPLTDYELRRYWLTERINDYGLRVDVAFAEAAQAYAEEESADISAEIQRLTGGRVSSGRAFAALKRWVLEGDGMSERARGLMQVTKRNRRTRESETKTMLDKAVRTDLLSLPADDLSPLVREVLELVSEAGRSSVSKYSAMVSRSSNGWRRPGTTSTLKWRKGSVGHVRKVRWLS